MGEAGSGSGRRGSLRCSVLAAIGMIGVLTISVCSAGFSKTRKRYLAAAAANAATGPSTAAPTKVRRVLPFAVPMAVGTYLLLAWMLLCVTH